MTAMSSTSSTPADGGHDYRPATRVTGTRSGPGRLPGDLPATSATPNHSVGFSSNCSSTAATSSRFGTRGRPRSTTRVSKGRLTACSAGFGVVRMYQSMHQLMPLCPSQAWPERRSVLEWPQHDRRVDKRRYRRPSSMKARLSSPLASMPSVRRCAGARRPSPGRTHRERPPILLHAGPGARWRRPA